MDSNCCRRIDFLLLFVFSLLGWRKRKKMEEECRGLGFRERRKERERESHDLHWKRREKEREREREWKRRKKLDPSVFESSQNKREGGCGLWVPCYCFPPTQKTSLFSLSLSLSLKLEKREKRNLLSLLFLVTTTNLSLSLSLSRFISLVRLALLYTYWVG